MVSGSFAALRMTVVRVLTLRMTVIRVLIGRAEN
jgi:hypothetical protein